MEKDTEEKFRSRYTLIDKTDPSAISAAQAAGVPIGKIITTCTTMLPDHNAYAYFSVLNHICNVHYCTFLT